MARRGQSHPNLIYSLLKTWSWRGASALLVISLLSGCGQAFEALVRTTRPNLGVPINFEGQSNVKISPGTALSTDGEVSARTHITITDRPMSSADVSARVSISRTRSEGTTQ
jgi:hypothetical protein